MTLIYVFLAIVYIGGFSSTCLVIFGDNYSEENPNETLFIRIVNIATVFLLWWMYTIYAVVTEGFFSNMWKYIIDKK